MGRYYTRDKTKPMGFREVTETEFAENRKLKSEVGAYIKRISNGEITENDVPETHRKAVMDRLAPTAEEKAKAYDILMGVSE